MRWLSFVGRPESAWWRAEASPAAPGPLLAVTLGVHAAVEEEVTSAWAEALRGQAVQLRVLELFGQGREKYDANGYYERRAATWRRRLLPELEEVLQQLRYTPQGDIGLDLSSVQGRVVLMAKEFQRQRQAAFFFCGMPTMLCLAFSGQPLPVVHVVPAPVTVQVPALKESQQPYLRALVRMMKDPKNHFAANTHAMQSSVLYSTGLELPVLPFLGFHRTAKYSGLSSREVLLHDRYSILRTYAWCAAMVDDYPFRLVDLRQTDRRFETFVGFRAAVYFPYTLDGQYAFYELYATSIPIFVPADPSWFLWPRVKALRPAEPGGRARCPKGQRHLELFTGRHELFLKNLGRNGHVYLNYTILCSGEVRASVANYQLLNGTRATERAELRAMEAMDDRGLTHVLLAQGGGPLQSHGRTCVRLRALPSGHLQLFVGVARLSVRRCLSGPLPGLRSVGWARGRYVREPLELRRPIYVDGLEREHRGSSNWLLMASLQRPQYVNPFDMISLRCLRAQWPHSPYAVYPHLGYFASAAELLEKLLRLQPEDVSQRMRAWQQLRREVGLKTWQAILHDVKTTSVT